MILMVNEWTLCCHISVRVRSDHTPSRARVGSAPIIVINVACFDGAMKIGIRT